MTRVLGKTTKVKNNVIIEKNTQLSFLAEGEKFKLRICLRGLHLKLSVLLQTRSAERLSSPHLAVVLRQNLAELVPSVFFCPKTWFLRRSAHFFQEKKNTRAFCNTVTPVTRVTSNRVEVHLLNSQLLAMVRTSNMAELVPSGISCLQPWFLQRSEHISLRKTPVFYVNPSATNKQLFKI